MNINITPTELETAKQVTKEFDKQKTHNKFVCSTNYIGYLGEHLLNKYFFKEQLPIEWVDFVKKGWSQPDFICCDVNIDVKSTHTDYLWITKEPVHDIYILVKVARDNATADIKGFLTKQHIHDAISTGLATKMVQENRVTYAIHYKYLMSMAWLPVVIGLQMVDLDEKGIVSGKAVSTELVVPAYDGHTERFD